MRRACLACVFLLAALPAPAAEAWPVPRGPSRAPAADPRPAPRVATRPPASHGHDPAAVANVPREFLDDAVATVDFAGSGEDVGGDGTVEAITHEVTRLNGRK